MIWTALYGALALGVLAATLWGHGCRHPVSVQCAVLLMCSWSIYNIACRLGADWAYPIIDFSVLAWVVGLWVRRHKAWTFALGLLLLADLSTHFAFHAIFPPTVRSRHIYALTLNLLYVLQLLTVLGGRYAGIVVVPGLLGRGGVSHGARGAHR